MHDFGALLTAYNRAFGAVPISLLFRSPPDMRRIHELMRNALDRGYPLTPAEISLYRRRGYGDGARPIRAGDALPDAVFMTMMSNGPEYISVADIFEGRRVVLFAVPGAFNPTSHYIHLPSFLENYEDMKAQGVDVIACTAVNDVFVLNDWAQASEARDKILFLADGNAEFASAIGMILDARTAGLGLRSKRYVMLVENRVVWAMKVEPDAAWADHTDAARLLNAMSALLC